MKILIYPNDEKKLRQKSDSVKNVTHKERKILEKMLYITQKNNGVGLSAIQVGIPKKMIVINLDKKILTMINPVIIDKFGEINYPEGCLSVPNKTVKIKRYKTILVEYLNEYGKKQGMIANDLLSVIIQHEIDHLEGKLIIDYE